MRLRLVIAYHGGSHEGWQSQRGGRTVQDRLEKAFFELCGMPVTVQGAGRTDAGVHANGQCAHADVPPDRMGLSRWPHALNARLDPSIRIMAAFAVSGDFHARFHAAGKHYRYRIWNASALPPLLKDRAWHVPLQLDRRALRRAARVFEGTHDFAAFSARRPKGHDDTQRCIDSIAVHTAGAEIVLDFKGPGFLYKMVRIVTAAIVRHAAGRCDLEDLQERLERGTPSFSHAAPAQGLCLEEVFYPPS